MIKLAVNGALGRMGSRILNLAYKSAEDFKITAAFEPEGSEMLGHDLGPALGLGKLLQIKISKLSPDCLKGCDVLIDFSSPEGTRTALAAALAVGAGIVVGTTGLDKKLEENIRSASKKIPIVFSPNMSIGANCLFELSRLSAAKLKEGYDIEIIERHHRFKKDAPSGTARRIAEVIAKEKGWDLARVAKYGREGMMGDRPKNEIGIHVVRAGDIVGEHTVIFSGPGETIEITHRAQSRDAFARGALVAAFFAARQKRGLYSMLDALK